MTFLSLFSGIGGMDLGLERAGMRCVGQVECVPFRRAILAKHWPNVRRHDDVRTFPADNPANWSADCIAGGFPCKQTSTAAAIQGRRNGLAGKESGLWFEMLRIVRMLRPEWVVIENTSGAATWSDQIKAGLEGAGYVVPDKPIALSASGLGAPHQRRRLFWVADRHGKGLEIARQARSPEADCITWGASHRDTWRPADARSVRVADGVPAGVDRRERISAIGDAVVPAMAEWLGRRIIEATTTTTEETK